MAHFAQIDENSTVLRVIVVNNSELLDGNGVEQEALGKEFCQTLLGGTWVQTSYHRSIRKNFASGGYTYDSSRDAFIPPKDYDSWVLDEETCIYKPPLDLPSDAASVDNPDGKTYVWDESTTSWKEVIE